VVSGLSRHARHTRRAGLTRREPGARTGRPRRAGLTSKTRRGRLTGRDRGARLTRRTSRIRRTRRARLTRRTPGTRLTGRAWLTRRARTLRTRLTRWAADTGLTWGLGSGRGCGTVRTCRTRRAGRSRWTRGARRAGSTRLPRRASTRRIHRGRRARPGLRGGPPRARRNRRAGWRWLVSGLSRHTRALVAWADRAVRAVEIVSAVLVGRAVAPDGVVTNWAVRTRSAIGRPVRTRRVTWPPIGALVSLWPAGFRRPRLPRHGGRIHLFGSLARCLVCRRPLAGCRTLGVRCGPLAGTGPLLVPIVVGHDGPLTVHQEVARAARPRTCPRAGKGTNRGLRQDRQAARNTDI
jgi:hypothetical protein